MIGIWNALLWGVLVSAGPDSRLPPVPVVDEPLSDPEATTAHAEVVVVTSELAASELVSVIESLPGVHVRSLGLAGELGEVFIRGMGGHHVTLVIDDLAWPSVTLSPVDLSMFDLSDVTAVELYRSGAPAHLPAPMGGVLRLVTSLREKPWRRAALVVGSFGQRHLQLASGGGGASTVRHALSLSYRGAAGDYTYYNDRETLYNAKDDEPNTVRTNNDSALLRLRLVAEAPLWSGLARAQALAHVNDRGIPGPGAVSAEAPRSSQSEALGSLTWSTRSRDVDLRATAHVMSGARRFVDPLRELGFLFDASETRFLQVGGTARAALAVNPRQQVTLALALTHDTFSQETNVRGPLSLAHNFAKDRTATTGAAEYPLWLGDLVEVVPSVRGLWLSDGGASQDPVTGISPKLGGAVDLGPCRLLGNVGRHQRPPTLLERYGDGVRTVPNHKLQSETGLSFDAGGRCGEDAPDPSWSFSLSAFALSADNLIGMTQSSLFMFKAENLSRSVIRGAEGTVFARLGPLDARVTYNGVWARSHVGERIRVLPQVPPQQVVYRLSWRKEAWTVRYGGQLQSLFYLDRANLRPVPGRWLHDAALTYTEGVWRIALAVDNLTAVRAEEVPLPGGLTGISKVTDFLGYPTPGRSVQLSVTLTSD